jgi:uncharacterized membrane protein YqjE
MNEDNFEQKSRVFLFKYKNTMIVLLSIIALIALLLIIVTAWDYYRSIELIRKFAGADPCDYCFRNLLNNYP